MDEGTFIRMIRDKPDDDGPRLVFADWLEDQGDPDRAEFIRVQIELSRTDATLPRWFELTDRETELLQRHRQMWLNPFGNWVWEARFRRGMVEALQISAETFLHNWPELFDRLPIRHLKLYDVAHHAAALAACPGLAAIHALDLARSFAEGAWLATFIVSPHLHALQTLDLSGNYLVGQDVTTVFESHGLSSLRTLRLSHNALGGGSFLGITARLPRLETLDLSHNRLRPVGAQQLAAAPLLGGLRVLDLSSNELDAAGVHELTASEYLTQLTELRLNTNAIADGGAIALANAPNFLGLERLALTANHVGARGARALAQSQHLTGLRHLDLRKNRFARNEARLLRRRFGDQVEI